MDKVLKELEKLRKEIDKIRIFCGFVAEEHEHIPHLKHVWNEGAGKLIYSSNTSYNDLNSLKAAIMKAFLELEDRVVELEKKGKRRPRDK
jgi:hypothetical protein